MSSQNEDTNGSPMDTVLMLLAFGIVGGAIYGFYFFEADYNIAVRAGAMIGAVVLSLLVVYQTAVGKSAWTTIQGSRLEMRKVVWPTRQEAVQTTLLIAVVVLILAVAIWGLDAFLLWGVKHITGRA